MVAEIEVVPWLPVTSPASAPVKLAALPETLPVTLPVKLPLNVPVVVPENVGASVKASVLRVGVPELVVRKRFVPLNSTEPKTGVVKLTPVARRRGAADAVPVGRTTVPVKVGLAAFALRLMAVCCAVETGLFSSLVLLTFPRPTIEAVIPLTVPVNVGLARGALSESALVMVEA